jgi:flagellin-specific chaperone FliS
MAIRKEYPERYDWWLNELESLGVSAKVLNDLNNIQEVSDLTENLKQSFYEEYKTTYNE